MTVNVYSPDDDASLIEGFTIVVDVFRAFSTAYYIDANNPRKYIIAEGIDHSWEIRKAIPECRLVGERQGIKIDGFDYGNSPTEIQGEDFSGMVIVHTTTAGTNGLLAQSVENEVVVGSFVNSEALLEYIRIKDMDRVNIYCTAGKGRLFGEEDYLFADYFKERLLGGRPDFDSIVLRLRKGSGKGFLEPGFAPYTDFLYSLDVGRFSAVLGRKIVSEKTHTIELERVDF